MTNPETPRRPGDWPGHTRPATPERDADTLRAAVNGDRARFELTLGSVRAHLEEQPSERAVRAAARRWINAITQLADSIMQDLR